MEQLNRIKIDGFRSIKSLELTLGPVDVLIGANGVGKSNFVDFFTMVNFAMGGNLQLYIGRKGGGQALLHYGSKTTPRLRAELQFTDNRSMSKYSFELAHTAGDRLIFAEEWLELMAVDEPPVAATSLGSGHRESQLLDHSLGDVAKSFVERLKEVQVYHFHDTTDEAQIRNSQDLDRNVRLLSHGGNLAAFLFSIQQTKPAHYQVIFSAFQSIVPYVQEIILRPDVLDPRRILLRWRDRNLDHEFGGHQLSDGSLRALALVTALLQPEETLPRILLLDEPELGLHPSGISLVASLIKSVSTKCQVIVATQSPRFLSEFLPEQVVVVERREDPNGFGESTFKRLDSAELKGWLQDYDLGTLYEMQVTGGAPR